MHTPMHTLTHTHTHTHAVTGNNKNVGHWVRKTQAKHAHIFTAVKYFKKGREKSKNNTHSSTQTQKHMHSPNTALFGAGDMRETNRF